MKITEDYNNPFDPNAPRAKKFCIKVNDYDLYEIAYRAKREKSTKTGFPELITS